MRKQDGFFEDSPCAFPWQVGIGVGRKVDLANGAGREDPVAVLADERSVGCQVDAKSVFFGNG